VCAPRSADEAYPGIAVHSLSFGSSELRTVTDDLVTTTFVRRVSTNYAVYDPERVTDPGTPTLIYKQWLALFHVRVVYKTPGLRG